MKYLMTIIRYEENKNYEAEMAKYAERMRGYAQEDYNKPSMEIPGRSLEVHLTEEEYKKIKENVIKIFE